MSLPTYNLGSSRNIAATLMFAAAMMQIVGFAFAQEAHTDSINSASIVPLKIRHLPEVSGGWQINGESGSLDWRIFMTSGELTETKGFQIAYSSSASVSPEASFLTLRINNVIVGRSRIAVPNDVKPIDFPIPPGSLHAGFNAISLSAEQRHRVDCTPEATYELWTRLNPALTGFIFTGEHLAPQLTELAALRAREDGTFVITALFEGRISPRRVNQIILMAQAIAISAKAEKLLVSLSSKFASDGINLAIGAPAGISAGRTAFDTNPPVQAGVIALVEGPEGSAPMITVPGVSDEEIDRNVSQFVARVSADELVDTSKTDTQKIHEISGGERIRLQDTGRPLPEFTGRFFRLPIDIYMPADFLAADYDKILLNLNGIHAANLLSSAQLQINVNGQDAANVPLSNPSGGQFYSSDIGISLGALRPGRNVIEIDAKLPDISDQSCDMVGLPDDAPKRFFLSGSSEIRFPLIARAGLSPELLQTTAGGYPYSIAASHPKLYVPAPDRDSLSAAITLAVRLAVAAGRSIPFEMVPANPSPSPDHGLVVAVARALDPALLKDIGMDPDAIRAVWEDRVSTNDRVETSSSEATVADPGNSKVTTDEWAKLLARRSYGDRALAFISSATARLIGMLWRGSDVVRAQIAGHATSRVTISPAASLIVGQGYRSTDDSGVITVVTSPDSASLVHSVEALTNAARWSGLRGRLTIMNASADVLKTVEASHARLMSTQPPSLRNSRLVLAGWFSVHPASYVMSAMMVAALLAFVTRSLVKNVGRKNG